MKKGWIFLAGVVTLAYADPQKIPMPSQPPEETAAPTDTSAPAQPTSTETKDPHDKNWKEYDNHIVKVHLRVNAAWTMMEVKETASSGDVSLTISRVPLVTFSVMREPMDAPFETYMTKESLSPQYPTGYKKTRGAFAGRLAFVTRGIAKDERMDESYFVEDGKSLYEVSFSAPEDFWKEAQKLYFDGIKSSFRWLQ